MLRCNTCGYINDEATISCAKCGADLRDAKKIIRTSSSRSIPHTTTGSVEQISHQRKSKQTIKGKTSDQPFLDESRKSGGLSVQGENNDLSCNNCRYPLRPHQLICPNCGFDNAADTNVNAEEDLHATKGFEEVEDAPIEPRHKTILDPWEVTGIGESKKFELVTDKGKTVIPFEGEEITLNRQNLDAQNKSISGTQHAQIEYKDGQWYVQDQSSNGFTFIQVRGRTPIQSGDMIIIGNKLFVFREK
ncbi:hypothetical protein BKI52_22110 [marine bacterium AO1-C]|nr:hypothetical protein BKI52_22110 [marine bacterium AO1-C]